MSLMVELVFTKSHSITVLRRLHSTIENFTRCIQITYYHDLYDTFCSTAWTTIDGYFLESHLKNAGTPMVTNCAKYTV